MKAVSKTVVHVGVSRDLQEKLVAGGEAVVDSFAKELGLDSVNMSRLKAFGILTGKTPKTGIAAMRKREGVEFVESDTVQKAL